MNRRTFSNEYKLNILAEAELSCGPGAIAALLRREGLYSSHLSKWRRQRASGDLQAKVATPAAQEVARLQRENERLRSQLALVERLLERTLTDLRTFV